MRIEYSVDDLKKLNFRYLVQLNDHNHHDNIFDGDTNLGFWIEKRIKFLVYNSDNKGALHGVYYGNTENMSDQELVDRLNGNKGRYYRPLNDRELRFFTDWLGGER